MSELNRLERMRTGDRNINGNGYEIIYDRINDYYMLSMAAERAIEINGKQYIIDRMNDLPVRFYTRDYLNAEGTIDYASLWGDMKRELSGEVWDDHENYIITINEDGEDEILWLGN